MDKRRTKRGAMYAAVVAVMGISVALLMQSCGAQNTMEVSSSELLPEQSSASTSIPDESAATPRPSSASTPAPASTDDPERQGDGGSTQGSATPQNNTVSNTPSPAPPASTAPNPASPAQTSQPDPAPPAPDPAPPAPAPDPVPPTPEPAPPAQAPVPTPEPSPEPAPAPTPPPAEPPPARTICNICGADITGNVSEHGTGHLLNGEDFSYRVE